MSVIASSSSTDNDWLKESSVHLQSLFILALDESSNDSWNDLFHFLSLLPDSKLKSLACLPETSHYIIRSIHKLNSADTPSPPQCIKEKLQCLFSTILTDQDNTDTLFQRQKPLPVSTRMKEEGGIKVTQHKPQSQIVHSSHGPPLLRYNPQTTPLTFSANKMTIKDIANSTDCVIEERKLMEQLLTHPSKMATSLSSHHSLSLATSLKPDKQAKPDLHPILKSDTGTGPVAAGSHSPKMLRQVEINSAHDKILQCRMKTETINDTQLLKTGIDVVRAFAFGAIPCGIQEVYLNFGNSVPWDPYHLVVVTKIKKNPTHTVATKFGFLHIYPTGESEHQSFTSWCRDSAVFRVVREIPMFRYYLYRKMIKQWRNNIRANKFAMVQRCVYNEGFRLHCPFMLALWMINSFCQDLLSLDVHIIKPLEMYDEQLYLENVHKSERSLLKFLRKFWDYSERALSNVQLETESRVLELETKKSHMPFVSDIPISIQKRNHLQLEDDLSDAIQRRKQLSKLIQSCHHIVRANMNQVVRGSVSQWLGVVLGDQANEDDDEENSQWEGLSRNSIISSTTDQSDGLKTSPCLLKTKLQLNHIGQINCSLTVQRLASILMEPLRIVEKCLFFSSCSPMSSTASSPGGVDYDYRNQSLADSISSSVKLLNPSLIADIQNNSFVLEAESKLSKILNYVSKEVVEFLKSCSWIEKLNSFLMEWCNDQSSSNDGGIIVDSMNPRRIESALMSGYIWLDKLSSLPHHFTTSYCLLSISTEVLVSDLAPRLESVMNTLQNNCIHTIHSLCMKLMDMIERHLEILSCKRYDLEGFAYYTQQLRIMREERENEHDNLTRSSTLLSSLLSSGVAVPTEVKKIMIDVETLWIECETKIKEMEEFVESQTPLKAQGLQENIENCEQEVLDVVASLSHPPYTDPSSDPTIITMDLQKIHGNALSIQSRLVDLIKWRIAITGHSHNTATVTSAIHHLECRKALWNHMLNFNITQNEWLRIPFKKLNIDEMHKILQDLLQSLNHLHHYLPPSDPVLEALRKKIDEYNTLLPLLKQLSSNAVKASHWHTLLAAVEEEYQPNHEYTLQDFVLYRLFDSAHTDLIVEVCQSAERESKLKNSLSTLQQHWEQMMLTLHKKPSDRFSFALPKFSPAPTSERITKFVLSPSQKPLDNDNDDKSHLIAAGNTKEILLLLEEDLTELQILRGVAQAESVKQQIGHWSMVLVQLQEIVHLLDTCQDRWWNILNLFCELPSEHHQPDRLSELITCSIKFQDIMNSIHQDPFVFSLLERRRGHKGYRDLQGDTLQQSLHNVHCMLETILFNVKDIILDIAASFPRLLMLSDWEILYLNNHHGNPALFLQSIRRMFPAITNINTIEIDKSSSSNDNIADREMPREEGYQIVSIEGSNLEWMTFCVPLPVGQRKGGEWLPGLERAIKYSLSCHLTGCLSHLPKRITGNVALEEEDYAVLLWLAENVSQAVILAVECHIGHLIRTCFEEDDSAEFRYNIEKAQVTIERAVSYCSQLIKSVGVSPVLTPSQVTVIMKTLRNIVLILRNKQDVLSSMERIESPDLEVMMTCVLYHGYVEATPTIIGRLGSQVVPSLTTSLSSIPQTIPAINRIQHTHDSTGTSPRPSMAGGSPLTPQSGGGKSIKSLVGNVPTTPTQCHVQYRSLWQQYGFEYSDINNTRMVVTPPTEKCYYQIMRGMMEDGGVYHTSIGHHEGDTYAKDIALVLGRPLLSLSCVTMTTIEAVRSILISSMQMGCILILSEFSCLNDTTRIKFNGLLDDVRQMFDCNELLITNDAPPKTINSTSGDGLSSMCRPSAVPSSHSLSSTSSLHNKLIADGSSIASRSNISKGVDSRIDWYNNGLIDSLLGKTAEVDVWGTKITLRSHYSYMIMTREQDRQKDVFREVGPILVDTKIPVECHLLSNGFSKANELSSVLLPCLEDLQELSVLKCSILVACKCIIETSQDYLIDEIRASQCSDLPIKKDIEEYCISKGLLHYINIHCITDYKNRIAILDIVLKWFNVAETGLHIHMELKHTSTLLINAIKRQLDEVHLQKNEEILDKIVQLHYGLLDMPCAILTGPCGSGKTIIYQTLVKAYNSFINDPLMKGQVQLHVINPAAYTVDEFIGSYSTNLSGSQSNWTPGIFPKLLEALSSLQHKKCYVTGKQTTVTDSIESKTRIEHWIVLDGPLSERVGEVVTKLLTNSQVEILPNGATLRLPDNCRIIIESSTSMEDILTPSLLPCCTLLYCQSLFSYRDIINRWLKRASTLHNLSITGIDVLSSLMESMLPSLIAFVCNSSNNLMTLIKMSSIDMQVFLVEKFLALLSSVLERNSPKENDTPSHQTASTTGTRVGSMTSRLSRLESASSLSTGAGGGLEESLSAYSVHHDRELSHRPSLDENDFIPNEGDEVLSDGSDIDAHIVRSQQYHTTAIFMFSVIWSFGAYISNNCCDEFSQLIHELASNHPPCCNMIPSVGLVFDYYLDLKTYCFNHWNDNKKEKTHISNTRYISVPELERFRHICDLYWSYGINVILIGAPGSGKTSFLKNMIQSRTNSTVYTVSHTLTSSSLRSSIIERLTRLRRRQAGGGAGSTGSKRYMSHKNSFILDDLHLASTIVSKDDESLDVLPFTSIHELVSMIAEHKVLPDPSRYYTHSLKDIQLFASCTDVGVKRLSLKLLRHFSPVQFFSLSDSSLNCLIQKRL